MLPATSDLRRRGREPLAELLQVRKQLGFDVPGIANRPDDGHSRSTVRRHERVARELNPIADTLMIQPLGPVVGAHAGPGVVGVGCYSADFFPLGIKTASAATLSR